MTKPEELTGLVTKAIAVSVLGILGIGVNSVSNINVGEKMEKLTNSIVELNGKVLVLGEKQDMINRYTQSQIDELKKFQDRMQERRK